MKIFLTSQESNLLEKICYKSKLDKWFGISFDNQIYAKTNESRSQSKLLKKFYDNVDIEKINLSEEEKSLYRLIIKRELKIS